MINLHSSHLKSCQNLQFAAEGFDDPFQRGDLHIGLFFELRQARLFDAKRFCDLLLALAGRFSNLTEQHFADQLPRSIRRPLASFLGRGTFDQLIE
ncbi:MAG: hypothetical protein WD648_07630 [Planctomycetaceae bacterium]